MRFPVWFGIILMACGARTSLVVPSDDAGPRVDDDRPGPDDRVVVEDREPARDAPDVPDVVRPMPLCGNGILDPGEGCDLGAGNRLVPAFQVSADGAAPIPVRPVVRPLPIASFYDYRSASAHTGFEAAGTVNLMVYANAVDAALGFVFLAGIDGDSQPEGEMRVTFTGLPESTLIALSDDEGELTRVGATSFAGRWNFENNTDGGAFSNLPWGAPWRVVIRGDYRLGVSALRIVDGRLAPRSRPLATEVVLEHFTIATACRPDCREARCGDGYLDAGERCDDGNRTEGDGCASDCLRLR